MPHQPAQAALGGQIRAIRRERGISQGALAAAAHIGSSTLSQLENGERNPSLDRLVRIADALGVGLARLFDADYFQAPTPGHAGAAPPKRDKLGQAVGTARDAIRADPHVTVATIAKRSGVSRATVERALDLMKGSGELRRHGPERGGSWELVGDGRG